MDVLQIYTLVAAGVGAFCYSTDTLSLAFAFFSTHMSISYFPDMSLNHIFYDVDASMHL
jgi:hypothetical protein